MKYSDILEKATALQDELISFRRHIHANPGVGFDLADTVQFVKEHENELPGAVVLCFQPSEETFEGAKDMIEAGVLRDTTPNAALMIHVTAGMPFESGTAINSLL